MSEFVFVLKCFLYTLLIVFLMQIKVSGLTIETRAENVLKNSRLTLYLQEASSGGTRLILQGYHEAKNLIVSTARAISHSGKSRESHASHE